MPLSKTAVTSSMRKATWSLCILTFAFLGGSLAQTVGGSIIGNAIGDVMQATQVLTQHGTSQSMFVNYKAQLWELSEGQAKVPVAKAGPLFKISRTESMSSAACGDNSVDNECNAALAVYAVGTAASGMQSNAVYGGAKTQSAHDGVAGVFIGDASGAATGIGTGTYIEGRRDAAGARLVGAEIRANNQSGVAGSYYPGGFSPTGALWLTASGANSGVGASLGSVKGVKFDTGFAATVGSVATTTISDDSSSTQSIRINGTHTYGVDASGMKVNEGGAPFLGPLLTPASSKAACKQGAIQWDASFIYVCTAANSWKRAALGMF
jgi:hypothetical protein